MALGEGLLLEKLDDAEGFAANCQNVHRPVVVALNDFNNFRGAPYSSNAFGKRQKNAELGFFFQATVDHFEITRLEDVQGKVCAGEKNDVQRKERYSIGPHSACSNDTRPK